jgi:hypothetical protein
VNDILEFEIVLRLENVHNYRLCLFLRQDASSVNYFLNITIAVFKEQKVLLVIWIRGVTIELGKVARLYLLEQF